MKARCNPTVWRTALLTATILLSERAAAVDLKSPDGHLALTVEAKDGVSWRVDWKGRPVIVDSRFGLEFKGLPPLGVGLELVSWKTSERDETWKPVYGERSEIRDRCRTAVSEWREKNGGRRLTLEFRVYDEGVALRYTLPRDTWPESVTISRERTEFRFAADHPAWATYAAQGLYEKVPVSRIKPGCERPMPVEVAPDCYAALGEAALVDFARMKFAGLTNGAPGAVSHLDGETVLPTPLVSPWRFAMVADSPGRLLENNYFMLNLNEPCAIADTSWIKPGKVLREVTLTTTGAKTCVDFCRKHNVQYILFDAGWYGYEYDDKSDARGVNLDPRRSKGPLDLQEVIRYAKDAGVGVILYVNRRALEKQLDEILPLYETWGVKGVKYGFVNVGSQKWTSWLHEAVRKAAAHKLMINVHDEYRGTGYTRTYPNFMTQEGIRGDEEKTRTNEQTLTILFSRYLAGAADNTICYFDERVSRLSTHAYQLAKAVCLYSPLQHMYWYDRPGPGGSLTEEPELEFFDAVPTVWDETRVLEGRIGEYAVIARRSGDRWFVGAMQSGPARTCEIPLSFLGTGRRYRASVYRDDPALSSKTRVRIERSTADSTTVLRIPLPDRGGAAVLLEPAPKETKP